MRVALTIAGFDPSCGAGAQADLKTFHSLGVYGISALTVVTVQNTQKVFFIQEMSPSVVCDQILCLFSDIAIDIVKIGMLSNSKLILAVSDVLNSVNSCPSIVLDPVMVSKSGYPLLKKNAQKALINELISMSNIVTPNLYEAEILTGRVIKTIEDMKFAARKIFDMGSKNVVVKGGHLNSQSATDVMFDGHEFKLMETQRIKTLNTHGTGCTFSSAIAAYMAIGNDCHDAVVLAKKYITGAIKNAIDLGKGCGPTNHFFNFIQKK